MTQLYLVDCPVCNAEYVFASPFKERWECERCGKVLYPYEEVDENDSS